MAAVFLYCDPCDTNWAVTPDGKGTESRCWLCGRVGMTWTQVHVARMAAGR